MRYRPKSSSSAAIGAAAVALCAAAALAFSPSAARAQQVSAQIVPGDTDTPPSVGVTAGKSAPFAAPLWKPVPALRLEKVPAEQAVVQISRATGATVIVNGALSSEPVTLSTIGGPLDKVLPELAAVLPKGTEIRAVFVPVPDDGSAPDGDAVSRFLNAAADVKKPPVKVRLGGPATTRTAGARTPQAAPPAAPPPPATFEPGVWEVLDHKLPLGQATAAAAGLGLRPVYLIRLANTDANPVALMGQLQADAMREWLGMTPDQRNQAGLNQFAQLMNMPSADRQALLGQMMSQGAQMMTAIQTLPADQRQSFLNDVKAAAQAAGLPTGGAPKQGGSAAP